MQIAQGKNRDAVAGLGAGRQILDVSDYGLAMALAGRPLQAIAALEPAARQKDADPVVRQNLALAHALAGHWDEARVIAGQDVPVAQLDARIQQWMQLAKPSRPSDQVAAFVGVSPAPVDAGQPVQLALNKNATRLAQVTVPQPAARRLRRPPRPRRRNRPRRGNLRRRAPRCVGRDRRGAGEPAPMVVAVAPAPPPARATTTLAAFAATAVEEAKAVIASVMPHSPAPAAKPASCEAGPGHAAPRKLPGGGSARRLRIA